MKRNIISVVLTLCAVLLLVPLVANAEAQKEGIFTYKITDGEATITACERTVTGHVEIPSTLGGYPVATIDVAAFSVCKMATVTIPDSVITIERSAFADCSELTSVTIPDSVVTIGDNAFHHCTKLETLTIGDGVKQVISPFYGCTALKEVYVSDLNVWCNIKFYWEWSNPLEYAKEFYVNGELITDLVIPSGITAINDRAFCGSTIRSVTIPGSVETVGVNAFAECPSLADVTVGEGVKILKEKAFWMCPSLTTVTLPDSLAEIETEVFWRCGELTNLTVGKGLKTVGQDAFRDCQKLDRLEISDVAAWCDIAFYDNYSNPLSYSRKMYVNGSLMKDLVIPEGVTMIRSYAFYSQRAITSLTIPDSVTIIEPNAFAHCLKLKKVTMGSGVKGIGTWAFNDCTALEDVYIKDLSAWCKIEFGNYGANPLFYAENFYVNGSAVKELVIPNGVTQIGRFAFVNCQQLTTVKLPDSLQEIGLSAFQWSDSIKDVYFYGTKEQWNSVTIDYENETLTGAKLHFCGPAPAQDFDGDHERTTSDAVYLLLSVMFGETDYPVPAGTDLDFNADGKTDTNDAVYLLLNIMFGAEDYPIAA